MSKPKSEEFSNIFNISIPGLKQKIPVNQAIVEMWAIMAILIIFVIVVRVYMKKGKFKEIPESKLQNFIEFLVKWVYDLVEDVMGKKYTEYAPLIGTLGVMLLFCNLFAMTGLAQPTAHPSVAIGFGLVAFFNIHYQSIKKNGFGGWIAAFTTPFKIMLPINILVELAAPVSLSMRLFGNMFAGLTILGLTYGALGNVLGGVLRFGLPMPLHFFFDLFDGVIQTFVFMMLTMVFIKNILQHGEHQH